MAPRIGFVHPDLGIGGAERLVVDAGIALQSKGYDIEMFTAHRFHALLHGDERWDLKGHIRWRLATEESVRAFVHSVCVHEDDVFGVLCSPFSWFEI